MSRVRGFVLVSLALLLGAAAALAQRDFSKVEIKPTKLADGLYMMTGAGGNLGVCAGPDGTLLIDDQFAELHDRIKAAIAAVSPTPVRFVFNTHFHGDHTGGNEAFGNAGAVIVAHDNVYRRLSVDFRNPVSGRETKAAPPRALPIVTFNDSATFHLNGHTAVVFHVANAHTDGDAIVWFPDANVLHAGDCLFNGMYPVIDAGAGGTLDGMITANDRILSIVKADTRIIPGHGPLATRADVEAFRDMLKEARTKIAPLVKKKKSLQEILAARPLAPLDAKWGQGSMKSDPFIGAVVAGMNGGRAPAK